MEINFDEDKIKVYAKIQNLLCKLKPNAKDKDIDKLIAEIPSNYLNQKEDLILICQLFAQYAKNFSSSTKGNAIKLFERIMDSLKAHLNDEPEFFWKIFDYLYCFKLWFYQNGLITFDQIVGSSVKDETVEVYFSPELSEKQIEYIEYDEDKVDDIKELREKYFKWLRNSNDYKDNLFKEIEVCQLFLSIKSDDLTLYKKIEEEKDDSNLSDSIVDTFPDVSEDGFSLIWYAMYYNSPKVLEYLRAKRKNRELDEIDIYFTIMSRNKKEIKLIKSQDSELFDKYAILKSIQCWNSDMIKELIKDYLFVPEVDEQKVVNLYKYSIESLNFEFLQTTLIPFMKKHPQLIESKINDFLFWSLSDCSCFFLRPILNHYDKININYHNEDDEDRTFLIKAVLESNSNAVKSLLGNSDIKLDELDSEGLSAFIRACLIEPNLKILNLLSSDPEFDIHFISQYEDMTALEASARMGNFVSIKYILDNFPDIKDDNLYKAFLSSIKNEFDYCLKLLVDFYLKKFPKKSTDKILSEFKNAIKYDNDRFTLYKAKLKFAIRQSRTVPVDSDSDSFSGSISDSDSDSD